MFETVIHIIVFFIGFYFGTVHYKKNKNSGKKRNKYLVRFAKFFL